MKKIVKITERELKRIISESVKTVLMRESQYSGLDDATDENDLSREAIKKGFKLIGYHNTSNPDLNRYGFDFRESGIHFGSLKAANDRGNLRHDDIPSAENWTHKYFLKVVKPLVIDKDFDWERKELQYWDGEEDDYYEDIDIYKYLQKIGFEIMEYENGEPMYARSIVDILADNGYDSIIYKNECEDIGKYSVAMFNPNNIKFAGETFDDSGKPIPLEKRFNTATSDVRY
jgi:hypothetical protein